jgi:uncharacterized membrane protein (DUF4010 family)
LLAASYWVRLKESNDLGLTTEVAFLLTFALGAASDLGDLAAPAAVAVIAALLLSMKQRLHQWMARVERLELEALLKLALISVVMLPLLPDQGYGPGSALNPYQIWWAVVVVVGLSFFGYAAIRLGGADLGILLTGLFGGLASSTLTTVALARLARAQADLAPVAASGVVVTGSVTFLRVLALVAVFQPSLIAPLILPMGVMAVLGLGGAAILRVLDRNDGDGETELDDVANPLSLGTALSFGALLTLVLLVVHYLEAWLGTGGVYVASALSGMMDVDAITISVAKLVGDDLTSTGAATAIFIAASVNTFVKAGVSIVVGGRPLGLRVSSVYVVAVAAGAVGLWFAVRGG